MNEVVQAYSAFFVGHKSSTLSFEVRDKDHIGAAFVGYEMYFSMRSFELFVF